MQLSVSQQIIILATKKRFLQNAFPSMADVSENKESHKATLTYYRIIRSIKHSAILAIQQFNSKEP